MPLFTDPKQPSEHSVLTDNLGSITYTGIGARKTPESVGLVMCAFAIAMQGRECVLRSGGADGADLSFESGAGDKKQVFLPYKGFNGNSSARYSISSQALTVAMSAHPAWDRCTDFARKAHARNSYQVLGEDLKTPTRFVVCWTPDGATNELECTNAGGTRTAIVIAARHNIPVINLARADHLEIVKSFAGQDALLQAKELLCMRGTVRPRTYKP